MKFTFLLAAGLLAHFVLNAQTIAQFNFNSIPADISVSSGSLLPTVGSGTINPIGGIHQIFVTGDGSDDPINVDDSAMQLSAFPLESVSNKSAGISIDVNTSGYQNIKISWTQRNTNTSSKYATLQYSIDGTNFIDFATYQATSAATWYSSNHDLSAITGLNNNSTVKFRIVSSFAPSTSSYEPSLASETYSHLGAWRIDYLTISADVVLAVNLLSFDAVKKEDEVLLKWQTSSEQNNDRFEIEHSTDGLKFTKIGEEKGQLNSDVKQDYQYIDKAPSVFLNYYRLKQVDLNGQFFYSPVKSVETSNNKTLRIQKISESKIVLKYPNDYKPLKYSIINMLGNVLTQGVSNNDMLIDIGYLPRGMYILATEMGVGKFIKE